MQMQGHGCDVSATVMNYKQVFFSVYHHRYGDNEELWTSLWVNLLIGFYCS